MTALPGAAGAPPMAFPGAAWEEKSPASQGLDPDRLRAAADYLERHSGRGGVRELFIVRNGFVVWTGPAVDEQHGVWSCTKSFASTVLGLLVDDGRCRPETRAAEHLPSLAARYPDVTLRHFTTMTSGYRAEGDEPDGTYVHGPSKTPFAPGPDPLFTPPGSSYAYWDSAMNQFAHVLTRIAGEPVSALFKRRIADPIGMDPAKWAWGDFGPVEGVAVNGGAGNHGRHVRVSAREFARLGHLYLNRGGWNGRRLLSPAWVDAATVNQVPVSLSLKGAGFDGRGCYGYNWWTNGLTAAGERKWPGAPPRTFAASGYNNNDMFVIPEWRMVVVRLGLDQGDGAISDAVYGRFLELIGAARADATRKE